MPDMNKDEAGAVDEEVVDGPFDSLLAVLVFVDPNGRQPSRAPQVAELRLLPTCQHFESNPMLLLSSSATSTSIETMRRGTRGNYFLLFFLISFVFLVFFFT